MASRDSGGVTIVISVGRTPVSRLIIRTGAGELPACDAHAVTPFQRIPDHRPVRDGQ
jgi:hypothetical protein